ncbi:MAG TPA: hypothetical protein VH912_15220 [Streptosporangiaceae bacterium]|jgi:hypothetical protein
MSDSSYDDGRTSGWTIGWVLFAAVMMMMTGLFQAIEGLAAIIKNEFYLVTPRYAFEFDVTAWGWIHLIVGIVVAVAGWFILQGQLWARIIGITAAVLSAIANFFFIPHYPFWSLLIITLDVFAIWALCVYGKAEARVSGMRN